jgi:hypothetical protein
VRLEVLETRLPVGHDIRLGVVEQHVHAPTPEGERQVGHLCAEVLPVALPTGSAVLSPDGAGESHAEFALLRLERVVVPDQFPEIVNLSLFLFRQVTSSDSEK